MDGPTEAQEGELVEALAGTLGPGALHRGDDIPPRYLQDATGQPVCRPLALVRPAATVEVSGVLSLCSRAGRPVVVQGGLTGLAGGAHPLDGEIILSLDRMNAVEALDPIGRTLRVQAGATLHAVQRAAEEAGLFYPVDLGSRGTCTIGGNAATNAGGVQVFRYGMTRRQIVGMEAVFADGRVVSALNRNQKDNTGYDWKQMIVGSEGTLAVITRLVLALQPRPADRRTALCAVSSLPAALALQRHLEDRCGNALVTFEAMWRSFLEVTAPHLRYAHPFPDLPPIAVLVETVESRGGGDGLEDGALSSALMEALEEGLAEDVLLARSHADRERFWGLREVEIARAGETVVHFDVSLPQGAMEAAIQSFEAAVTALQPAGRLAIFGHLADGNLHLAFFPPAGEPAHPALVDRLYEAVIERDGSVSAEHGIGTKKRAYLRRSKSPEELAFMAALKAFADPGAILGRGRVL